MNLIKGHNQCGIAIGVTGEAILGYGELNEVGYWQHPCEQCAREWEKQNPNGGHAWPYTEKHIRHMKRKIHKDMNGCGKQKLSKIERDIMKEEAMEEACV